MIPPASQAALAALTLLILPLTGACASTDEPLARNAIFFVGDGMGVSTVSAARVFAVGADGDLVLDGFPHVALSRTATSDYITADSAGTMSAMITGHKTNSLIISLDKTTEFGDFNADGDGARLITVLEQAKAAGKKVGVVTTARITHATPAACYAHINDRNLENDIALQALPSDPTYNTLLGAGVDLLVGGGRRHFLGKDMLDEEGKPGARGDGRDLRVEFQEAGYTYLWNAEQWAALRAEQLPALALLESSHMEYELDRPSDEGGEPSLLELTRHAIALLEEAADERGWFLMVESGRIDHAHHAGNAQRSLIETAHFDAAIGAAIEAVDTSETLIIATADHSHTFLLAGYPMRPLEELPYKPKDWPEGFELGGNRARMLGLVHGVDAEGHVVTTLGSDDVPYTALLYGTGPGARAGARVSPLDDRTPGHHGDVPDGPDHPAYRQAALIPTKSETHAGEDVAIYGMGPGAQLIRGTLHNTRIAEVLREALGL